MQNNGSPTISRPITRRSFLRTIAPLPVVLGASSAFGTEIEGRSRVRFGLIADVHQDVMADAVDRIRAFVAHMKEADADFILQLGDFCQPHPRNAPFIDAWNAFHGPKYHVLGNHDMDGGYSREQTVAYYGMPGRHYTFDAGPARGIVLDGNDPGGRSGGYKRYIAQDQQAWLQHELSKADRPVIVFVHQPLDEEGSGVENGAAVRAILERANEIRPGTVLAVFAGHFHQDYVREIAGIDYVQINSASYVWLPADAARETFPPEVHQTHPYLRNVAAYREPLWAMVTVDLQRRELLIEGRESTWVGPDPWERGASESRYPRNRCRPAITDRRLLAKWRPG